MYIRESHEPVSAQFWQFCGLYVYVQYLYVWQYLYLFCAALARIRRLRKSPQYLLIILHGEMTVSAYLRKRSAQNVQHNFKIPARDICMYVGMCVCIYIYIYIHT